MKTLKHLLIEELCLGRALVAMGILLALAQGFELAALAALAALYLSPLTMAQIGMIAVLFLFKGIAGVFYNVLFARTFTQSRYSVKNILLKRMDQADFTAAKKFLHENLGYLGRQLAESIFNIINGGLQLFYGSVFLASLFVIVYRYSAPVALLGLSFSGALIAVSYLMNQGLERKARQVLKWEFLFEKRWSEQLQIWLERRYLGLPGEHLVSTPDLPAHVRSVRERDLIRVAQPPVLELLFLLMLFAIVGFLQSQQLAGYALIVAYIVFLQRIQARVQMCLLAWQQIRDEWPIWEATRIQLSELTPIARMAPAQVQGLKVEGLHFAYGSNIIFQFLSFTVAPGEWLRIDGENGSGKSTLSQLLVGLLRPQKGTVGTSPRCALIAGVPTISHGDLYSNLDMGRNLNREFILERLAVFGLVQKLAQWNLHLDSCLIERSLSTGEKQVIGVARALLQDLDILILDEGTSHMGVDLEREILQNLKAQRPHLSVIVISHRDSINALVNRSLIIGRPAQKSRTEKDYSRNSPPTLA